MNQVFPGRGDPTGTDTQAVKCSVLVLNLGLRVKGLGFRVCLGCEEVQR